MRNRCPLINDKCGVLTDRGLTKGGEYFSAYSKYSSDISQTGGERLLNIAGFVRLPSEKDKVRRTVEVANCPISNYFVKIISSYSNNQILLEFTQTDLAVGKCSFATETRGIFCL